VRVGLTATLNAGPDDDCDAVLANADVVLTMPSTSSSGNRMSAILFKHSSPPLNEEAGLPQG
jgi:hypothetical protein